MSEEEAADLLRALVTAGRNQRPLVPVVAEFIGRYIPEKKFAPPDVAPYTAERVMEWNDCVATMRRRFGQ